MNFVMDNRLSVKRHGKAHDPLFSYCIVCCPLLVAQVAAMAIIARGKLLRLLFLAHLVKSLRRTVTAISMTGCNQLMSILLVQRSTLCLVIGRVGTTHQGTLVNIHTEPA